MNDEYFQKCIWSTIFQKCTKIIKNCIYSLILLDVEVFCVVMQITLQISFIWI